MGEDLAEPPEDADDVGFGARLLEANAQAAEAGRLAKGFRDGFPGRRPYSLKDLLVEIVLSPWFRASSFTDDGGGLRAAALSNAGARRLLTPEELARKTAALTGFQWGRGTFIQWWQGPHTSDYSALTDEHRYRLLYGGINSAGITQRARDMTAVMAGVARAHAMEASCPIVLRELYLLPESRRRLFAGFDRRMSPVADFRSRAEVKETSWARRETVSLRGSLSATTNAVSLVLAREAADAMLRLDSLSLRIPGSSEVITTIELEDLTDDDLENPDCGEALYNDETGYHDHWALWQTCRLRVPVDVAMEGMYDVEVVAWADLGDEESLALEISVESDTEILCGVEGNPAQASGTERDPVRNPGRARLGGGRCGLRPVRRGLGTEETISAPGCLDECVLLLGGLRVLRWDSGWCRDRRKLGLRRRQRVRRGHRRRGRQRLRTSLDSGARGDVDGLPVLYL